MERIHISLLISLVLGVIPAIIASQKGRSAVGWYLYGFLAFPIAFIHSILAIEVHRAPCPTALKKFPQARQYVRIVNAISRMRRFGRPSPIWNSSVKATFRYRYSRLALRCNLRPMSAP